MERAARIPTTMGYQTPLRAEPFGQAGVRQYVGSFLALLCAVLVAVSLSLWYRSTTVNDRVDFFSERGQAIVQSAGARVMFIWVNGSSEQPATWAYTTRPLYQRRRDFTPETLWKTIGLEVRPDTFNGGRTGFWVRVRWPIVAGLLVIWPALHAINQFRRRPVAAAAPEVKPMFCARCGRPVHAGDTQCAYCGRAI